MSLTKFGEKLELRSEVEITASAATIWRELTQLSEFSKWNPYVVNASGVLSIGARVNLVVSPPGGKEMNVRRRVDVLREAEELRWTGPYGFGLLLRSEQYFRLSAGQQSGSTRLSVGENLMGPGVTGSSQTVMNIARGLALMNQALKRRLESAYRSMNAQSP